MLELLSQLAYDSAVFLLMLSSVFWSRNKSMLRLTSSRFFPLMLIIIFRISPLPVVGQSLYEVKVKEEKALYCHSFSNITETSLDHCMERCLENCRCLSFQLCDDKTCELCSSHDRLSPSAFHQRKGCTHYVINPDLSKAENPGCHQSCSTGINCCMTSHPCLNGGSCEPTSLSDNKTRFRCGCLPGYTGNLCQHPVYSCRGYVNISRGPGNYTVLDGEKRPFEVFCDFDLNLKRAWTLIQSYELQHKKIFQKSFATNYSINENNPSWGSYRLSKSRMESIQNHSSKWRITCRYNKDGLNYTDYIRGANEKLDILTYDADACQEVEYINIRGWNCSNCKPRLIQAKEYPLHTDSHQGKGDCAFPSAKRGEPCTELKSLGEDNFGYYNCINPAHRCTTNETSTTQTWFGG